MEYNDTTCSMYTLLIKWGCTPSKESNIVLVWCDCFVCPRTFEKLVPTPLAEFQGWGPTLFFCSKLCAIENCSGRFRDWFLFFFIPAWEEDFMWRSRDGLKPEDDWRLICINTRLVPVEADFQAHPFQADLLTFGGASLWNVLQWNPVVAITILSK